MAVQTRGIHHVAIICSDYMRSLLLRPSYREAATFRHLAFAVTSIAETFRELADRRVPYELIRVDPVTGKRFIFIADPDGLPIEFYEL